MGLLRSERREQVPSSSFWNAGLFWYCLCLGVQGSSIEGEWSQQTTPPSVCLRLGEGRRSSVGPPRILLDFIIPF